MLACTLPPIPLVTGCDFTGLGTDSPELCTKASCGFDAAFIGGNLEVPIDMPIHVLVQTCIDDVCEPERELGPNPIFGDLMVRGAACPRPPFICTDTERWWVGWAPSLFTSSGELVRTFGITVKDFESGAVLEQHEFEAQEAEFETVEARNCTYDGVHYDANPPITCLHFIKSWN